MDNPLNPQGQAPAQPSAGPQPHPAMPVYSQPVNRPSDTIGASAAAAADQPSSSQANSAHNPHMPHAPAPQPQAYNPMPVTQSPPQPQMQQHQYNPMVNSPQIGPEQKREDRGKKIIIVVSLVVAAIVLLAISAAVIAALVSGGESEQTDRADTTPTLPTQTNAEPEPDVATFGEIIPSTASVNMKLDGVAEPVDMTIRVKEVVRDFVPPTSSYSKPAIGNEFAILSLEVTNNGAASDGLFSTSFYVTDENGIDSRESFSYRAMEENTKYNPRIKLTDQIAVGATNSGYMLVEIADDATSLDLNYRFKVTVLGNADLSVDEVKTAKIF